MAYTELQPWRPSPFVARKLGLRGFGGLSYTPPPMRPVPVPRGLPQPRMLASGGGSIQDFLRARDAMANRLKVFPDYRVLTQEEARNAIDTTKAALDPKRAEIDAYLATMSATDPVPQSINFQLTREDAQTLILAYMWYASAGTVIYEDGTASAMVAEGEWDQSFVDGDIQSRTGILDTLAQWDREGFIDRSFGTPSAAGLGAFQLALGPAIIIGLVLAAVILGGIYYLVTTTNFAKETELRLQAQIQTCDKLRNSGKDTDAVAACNKLLKQPASVAEEQAGVAKTIAMYAIGGLLIYGLVVYGLPHWLDVYDARDRRVRSGG